MGKTIVCFFEDKIISQKNFALYVKVRISGNKTGSYTLRVSKKVFANYVTINKSTITLEKDVLYELPITPDYTYKGYNGAKRIPGLSVSIKPSNVDEQKIWWWESSDILNCSYGWDDDGERYIHVKASEKGIAKLYAQDWSEYGKRDECTVYVGGEPVTGISLDCTNKTIRRGDSDDLVATVYPSNALNKNVIWNSSNTRIAKVDAYGTVTAKSGGSTTITAQTVEGNYSANCSITVETDTRERVKITKDGDYFNVTFEDGIVWKSVGRDLSITENTSGYLGHGESELNNLFEWEQRFLENFRKIYTVDQLAYIYYFDPLGVENYMVNINAPIYRDKSTLGRLIFRDSLYDKIFGIIPTKFYFNDDGVYYDYQNLIGWNRLNYYSNAEVLFGWHRTPINWSDVVKAGMSTLFNLVIGLIPPIAYIQNGVTLYKYAFYGASIIDFNTTLLTSYFDLYDANPMIWAISLLSAIGDATFSQFDIPNDMTIDVYKKVESLENYKTVFMIGEHEVSMSDVISHC